MKAAEKKTVMDALDQFVDKVLAYTPKKKRKRGTNSTNKKVQPNKQS